MSINQENQFYIYLFYRTKDQASQLFFETDSFNCTFDQGLCNGWTNLGLYDDDFEWTINKKSTPTGGTGPSFDHTVQNERR